MVGRLPFTAVQRRITSEISERIKASMITRHYSEDHLDRNCASSEIFMERSLFLVSQGDREDHGPAVDDS